MSIKNHPVVKMIKHALALTIESDVIQYTNSAKAAKLTLTASHKFATL